MLIYPEHTWSHFDKCIKPKEQVHLLIELNTVYDPKIKSIFLQMEPEAILPIEDFLIKNYNKYTYIITFNQNIVNSCPNAIKYFYGTSWITHEEVRNVDISKKKFEISSVFGNKDTTIGHRFRRQIFLNRHILTSTPLNFFLSCNANFVKSPLIEKVNICDADSKISLFKDSQFHLCIENSRQVNYFTEKLIDSLITYTIPIYYGCPNISDFFDTTGWIILENDSISELNSKIRGLDENYYNKYFDTVLKNQKKAVEYMDLYTNINKALKKLPEFQ